MDWAKKFLDSKKFIGLIFGCTVHLPPPYNRFFFDTLEARYNYFSLFVHILPNRLKTFCMEENTRHSFLAKMTSSVESAHTGLLSLFDKSEKSINVIFGTEILIK